MAKNARSLALDSAMEQELKEMLALGIEKAPIFAKTLHHRLKTKGIVKGGLSTLSKPDRKMLIEDYRSQQLAASEVAESKHTYGSLPYFKARNQQLQAELTEKKVELSKNTRVLVAIINRVESKTAVKVEDLLSPHLVREKDLLDFM